MGVQATSTDKEMPGNKRGNSVMAPPLWMLVPLVVLAIGTGLKFWRLTSLIRKQLLDVPSQTERFRQRLDRIWSKNQQTV